MTMRSALVSTLAALTATGAVAATPPEPLVLTNANVVDIQAGSVRPGLTLLLRNGTIESVGPASAPAGLRTIDLRGRHVLPGLVDAHTHISTFAAARQALESGVTTVRSSGVSWWRAGTTSARGWPTRPSSAIPHSSSS
jgi:imidazolonepropionase-like amidohydrolase